MAQRTHFPRLVFRQGPGPKPVLLTVTLRLLPRYLKTAGTPIAPLPPDPPPAERHEDGKLPQDAPRSLSGDRYVVHAVLGVGGMATVYKAWDRQLAVFRAIKVLSPELAKRPAIRSRFLTEAKAMARLQHPFVVAIQDVADADGQTFIVMELIGGGTTWERVVRDGPWPEKDAVRIVSNIASAVEAAHEAGIIHRDIKPQNILITTSGDARLTDFGIARFDDVRDRRAETRTGTVMGTWGFMPPEQRNDTSRVGPRSDIYALGATLWSLVRGRTPTDLFMADREPEMLEGLSPELARIVVRATRYRPDDRFSSAGQFAADLHVVQHELKSESLEVHKAGQDLREQTSGTLMALLDPAVAPPDVESPTVEAPAEERSPHNSLSDARSTAQHRTRIYVGSVASLAGLMVLFYWMSERIFPQELPTNLSEMQRKEDPAPEPLELVYLSDPATTPAKRPEAPSSAPLEQPSNNASAPPIPLVPALSAATAAPASSPQSGPKPPSTPEPPALEEPAGSATAPPEAHLTVTGDLKEIWFTDEAGVQFEPGSLPAGNYAVAVLYDPAAGPVPSSPITIQSGDVVTLECTKVFQKCKLQRQ